MERTKNRLTPADRKAIALAAYLFYTERNYSVELHNDIEGNLWELRIMYSDTRPLEQCPLVHHDFITSYTTQLAYSELVTIYIFPLQ